MTARITLRDEKKVGLDLVMCLILEGVDISKVSYPNERVVTAARIPLFEQGALTPGQHISAGGSCVGVRVISPTQIQSARKQMTRHTGLGYKQKSFCSTPHGVRYPRGANRFAQIILSQLGIAHTQIKNP